MSGFSPEWLALREPIDHRSRDRALAERLTKRFRGKSKINVVDLGCGTGSNLRATSQVLDVTRQSWTLVDYDPRLLSVAGERLAQWSDRAIRDEAGLVLFKGDKTIEVTFRQADLVKELDSVLGKKSDLGPDLVTASALFDLCSTDFIETFAGAVAKRRAVFYTVLTYNGVQQWMPAHASDEAMTAAFHAHQKTDKGFGVSAGPDAPPALATAFRARGYRIDEGDSPWDIGRSEQSLIDALVPGFAGAVRETGAVTERDITAWLAVQRHGSLVGHTDTLAVPL